MSKTTFLKIRIDPADMLEIERQARTLNMPKSRLARILLTGGAVSKPQQPAPAATTTTTTKADDSRLASIEDRLAEVEESLSASARAFDTLLSNLNELLRVPSFREYRARAVVDGIEKRQTEDDMQHLMRIASRYFVLYQRWPNPRDSVSFGPVAQGVDLSKFPTQPPS